MVGRSEGENEEIKGGKMRQLQLFKPEPIQLFKTKIHQEAIDNVNKVLVSSWVGLGPQTVKFEEEFARYIEVPNAVAFNSCTEALRAAIELSGLPKGSIVISTPLTFVSTNHVILQAGLIIKFADIDITTGNIDLGSIRRLCRTDPKPRAIMAVHYGGHPINLDFLYEIAKEYKLLVIEDAAHACGAKFGDRKIGQAPYAACFSFHAVKNLAIGDGGMLTTFSDGLAEKARKFRWLGIDKSTSERNKKDYSWKYDVEMLGMKSHMNDIQASIGLGQLPHLDDGNEKRHSIYMAYKSAELPMLCEYFNVSSSHHLAVMLAKDRQQKENIIANLTKNNIQYGVHYLPNYCYPMYKDAPRDNGCKNVEEFYNCCISLPCHLYLQDNDLDKIITTIKKAMV